MNKSDELSNELKEVLEEHKEITRLGWKSIFDTSSEGWKNYTSFEKFDALKSELNSAPNSRSGFLLALKISFIPKTYIPIEMFIFSAAFYLTYLFNDKNDTINDLNQLYENILKLKDGRKRNALISLYEKKGITFTKYGRSLLDIQSHEYISSTDQIERLDQLYHNGVNFFEWFFLYFYYYSSTGTYDHIVNDMPQGIYQLVFEKILTL